jgi:hypothetical protein
MTRGEFEAWLLRTDYAVQIRFPGDYYPVSKEEYERALELAERVLRWVHLQAEEGEGEQAQ